MNELIKTLQSISVSNNENSEICRECGGLCCKTMGCNIFPQDVKSWFNAEEITQEMIIKLLDSGYVTLDWWEGDIRDHFKINVPDDDHLHISYYLHMRNECDGKICGSWGGRCKALGENGCIIPWEKRPTGGKALVPDARGYRFCNILYGKPECALTWIPYTKLLQEI